MQPQGLFATAFCGCITAFGNPFCNILHALPGAALPLSLISSIQPDPVPKGTSMPHLPTTYKILPSGPPNSKLVGDEKGTGIFLSNLPEGDIITTCWAPPQAVVEPGLTCKAEQQHC
eukprot:GHUV01012356.1.p1 GENE.GHUV01012356.1~~GHUV01012356.1.p1  ORF type:complete len:117 (+),score=18.27 GHUV01012356.1:246-596(+)